MQCLFLSDCDALTESSSNWLSLRKHILLNRLNILSHYLYFRSVSTRSSRVLNIFAQHCTKRPDVCNNMSSKHLRNFTGQTTDTAAVSQPPTGSTATDSPKTPVFLPSLLVFHVRFPLTLHVHVLQHVVCRVSLESLWLVLPKMIMVMDIMQLVPLRESIKRVILDSAFYLLPETAKASIYDIVSV